MHLVRRLLAFALFAACLSPAQTAPAPKQPGVTTPPTVVDINTATVTQLKSLPGIGEAYARRIIEGRPYTAKNQLVTHGVLPQAVYDRVAAKMIAKHVTK